MSENNFLKNQIDAFEQVEMRLAQKITEIIYFPIKDFIKSINSKEVAHDLGIRIELFKPEVEKEMINLKKIFRQTRESCGTLAVPTIPLYSRELSTLDKASTSANKKTNMSNIINLLQEKGDTVVKIKLEQVYSFPKNVYNQTSEEEFIKSLKKEIKQYNYYAIGNPKVEKIIKIKKE